MKREIITIDEYGRLDIPTDTAAIWMTEAEIVELFGTTAGAVNSAIKAIIKKRRPTRLRCLQAYPSGQRQQCGRV